MKIIATILAQDKKEFKKQYSHIAPYFKYIQIDIMDGEFVKNKTKINPYILKDIIKDKNLEIHLMVKALSKYITTWSKVKNVKKIIWHYEANSNKEQIKKFINFLKKKKIKSGLAFNPTTRIKEIEDLIKDFDTIQVMGVKPGKMGQKFQISALEKIKKLRKNYPQLNIALDGGCNNKNIEKIKKTGTNSVALGSYLQKCSDIKKFLKSIS